MGGVHRDRSTESSGMEGLVDNSCRAILWTGVGVEAGEVSRWTPGRLLSQLRLNGRKAQCQILQPGYVEWALETSALMMRSLRFP